MNQILHLFYDIAWTIAVIILLPFIPFIRGGRLSERLNPRLFGVSNLDKSIWVHALSVGEVLSSLPLVRALRRAHPERDILFSVTTAQGMKLARKELGGEVAVFLSMPLDFWWSIRRVVRHYSPTVFILVETDLWPGLLLHLKKQGIRCLLINGRISPRTLRSYRIFRFFVRRMLHVFEYCLMQSDLDRDRVLQVKVKRERAVTTGNIKFDREWPPMEDEERAALKDSLKLAPEQTLWIAGSTHEGEEEIVLDVFLKLRHRFPGIKLLIAPRKTDRAKEIQDLGLGRGLRTVLKTSLSDNGKDYDVLILNTIGELGRIYGIAELSFVGGSLAPIGGHNVLEPASFGQPVLFGPHMHNFVLMSRLLVESGGGRIVKDEKDLLKTMQHLLSDPQARGSMGRRAKTFVEANQGALARAMTYIEPLL